MRNEETGPNRLPKKTKWLKRKSQRVINQQSQDIEEQNQTIANQQQTIETTAKLILQDHLTGLPNRKWFEEELKRKHAEAKREGKSMWVIMMDIDFFKIINDEFGHGMGDQILREFGQIGAREDEPVARIGGEEFAQAISEDMTFEEVQKLLSRYSANFKERSKSILGREATLSFGVAKMEEGETYEQLLEKADTALYQSKETGRDKGTLAAGRYYSTINLIPLARPPAQIVGSI